MKFKEIKEGLHDRVTKLVKQISSELGDRWLLDTETSMRMWTRGDGARYKEPSRIYPFYHDSPNRYQELIDAGKIDPSLTDDEKVINAAWNKLISLPNAKPINKISGEFPSIPPGDAVMIQGVIFIKDRRSIRYGSRSLLRNADVWSQE